MIVKLQAAIIYRYLGLSLCLLLTATALAQQPPAPRSGVPETSSREGENSNRTGSRPGPNVIVASDEDYRLAVSDVIEVIIQDAPELSSYYRIGKSGTIPLHYLGSMNVVGKTPPEVSKAIADGLRGRYLRDPKVYVSVTQYNSRTFFIQGAVRTPGVHVIEGRPSLFKLIAIAGGLQDKHGSIAYVIREVKATPETIEARASGSATAKPAPATPIAQSLEGVKTRGTGVAIEGEGEYELYRVPISGLFKGRFEQNIIIEPGDVVHIPAAEVFYVAGEVRAPGQYQYKEGITLRQAISLAQGAPFKAALNRGIIFREDPMTGKFAEVPVDIAAVMNGKREDVPILPNDVVVVPNSAVKSVSSALLMALGVGVATRVPIGVR
jgi:polysaccharide biosynthesis/export protein